MLEHAGVTRASVRVRREGESIVVEVEDDGAGGADPGRGSGLRGLEDRVAALDGTLRWRAPRGGDARDRPDPGRAASEGRTAGATAPSESARISTYGCRSGLTKR